MLNASASFCESEGNNESNQQNETNYDSVMKKEVITANKEDWIQPTKCMPIAYFPENMTIRLNAKKTKIGFTCL